jgi:hypothetical protein
MRICGYMFNPLKKMELDPLYTKPLEISSTSCNISPNFRVLNIRKVSRISAKKSVMSSRQKHGLYCSTCSLPLTTRNLVTGQGHTSKNGCPIPLEIIIEIRTLNRKHLLESLQVCQPDVVV